MEMVDEPAMTFKIRGCEAFYKLVLLHMVLG